MFPQLMPIPTSLISFGSPLMVVHADNWDYRPMTEWGQGDLNTEQAIRMKVATPERQIGIISEAVIELSSHFNQLADALLSENMTIEKVQRCAKSIRDERSLFESKIQRLHRLIDKVEEIKKEQSAKSPEAQI